MFAPRYSRPCLLNAVLCAMSGFLREIATGAKSYRARVMRKVSLQVDAKKEVIDLSGFKDALSETARQFASRAQQDAQEFFTAVLEALSSETLRAARTSGGPEHVSRKGPMSGDTQAAFSDADLCARSFGMCLRHTLTCQNTVCVPPDLWTRRSSARALRKGVATYLVPSFSTPAMPRRRFSMLRAARAEY